MPDATTSPVDLAVNIVTRRMRKMTRAEIYAADDTWETLQQVSNALYRARKLGRLDRDDDGGWHKPDRQPGKSAERESPAGGVSAGTDSPVSPAEACVPAAAAGASTAADSPTSAGDAGSEPPNAADTPTPDAPAGEAGTGAPESEADVPDGIRRLTASLPGEALDAPLRLTSADATAALWSDGHLTIRAPDAGVELTLAPDITRTLCRYLDRLEGKA